MTSILKALLMCLGLFALAGPLLAADRTERAAFAQYCFWTGEMKFGQMDGVVQTEAGYLQGHEVTLVDYDPAKISFAALVKQATAADLAEVVYVTTDQQAAAARLDLTPVQATKVNAWIRSEPQKALGYLAPAQRKQMP